MNVGVPPAEKLNLGGIRRLIQAREAIDFKSRSRAERYVWVEQVLAQHEYATLGKADRGLVRRYIGKMTGLSRAQTTRLIARSMAAGGVRSTVYRRRRFPSRYTRAGADLLARADQAHDVLSGLATRRICESDVRPLDEPYLDERLRPGARRKSKATPPRTRRKRVRAGKWQAERRRSARAYWVCAGSTTPFLMSMHP